MSEHTPGPWYYAFGAVWKDPDAKTFRIAKMDRDTPETWPPERDANARLIAAAPELLEALKELVRWMDVNNHSHTPKGGAGPLTYGGDEYSVVTDARQAVDKATKGTP